MKSPTLIFIYCFLFGGVTTSLFGQESPFSKTISLQTGYNKGLFKDSNFSPLNYQNSGTAFQLGYQKISQAGHLFGIQLAHNSNTIRTDNIPYFTSDYYFSMLAINYLRKGSSSNARNNWYIGGTFKIDNQLVFFEGTNGFTYLFNNALHIKGKYDWQYKKSVSFSAQLGVPILNYLIRPPHNGFNKTTEANEDAPLKLITEDGNITSLNNFVEVDGQISATYELHERWSATLGYALLYQRHRDIHRFDRLNHQAFVGLNFHFGI